MEEVQSRNLPENYPSESTTVKEQLDNIKSLKFLSENWKQILLLVLSTFLIYSITLTYDFVNYDDYYLVYQNESFLKNPVNIFNSFSTSAFTSWRQESVYYRPILLVSYIIDYNLWNLNPSGYHFTNIVLHLFSGTLLYLLLMSMLKNRWFSLFGALVFSLHPINVESVAWIAGRNDILLGLFILMMIYFYHRWNESENKNRFYLSLSVLSFTLALFTKESAAFYIILIPVYEIILKEEKLVSLFSLKFLKRLSLFFIPLIIYLSIRVLLFGKMIGAEEVYGNLSLSGRLQLAPAILMENLKFIILPVRLSIDHPLDKVIWTEAPWVFFAFIISILLIVTLFIATRRKSNFSFALFWIAVGLLPALNIIPLAVPILEHRLYTPLAGFSLVLASIGLSIRFKEGNLPGKIFISILVIIFAALTFMRIPVWKNSESLWLDTIAKIPSSQRPYFNLAGYYFDKQEYDKSISLLKKYIELAPDDFSGYSKLRQTYYISGKIPEAVQVCRELIRLDWKNENRYIELGTLFEQLNQPDSAISIYNSGIKFDSAFYRLHERLGLIYANLNQFQTAKQSFVKSIHINPNYGSAYFNLAKVYAVLGNPDSSLTLIQQGEQKSKIPTDVAQLREYILAQKQK
ncbi:MAG: hypothetical protein HY964_08425 [Ignavibacteriales bacterium]|nr:hypothetical protein [Ignavibacteriales bacterium]